jgi:hypothetical protein
MPLYEYTCEETGETIELIRPMADADKPLTDAEIAAALGPDAADPALRNNRRFTRRLSTFQAKSDAGKRVPLPTPGMGGGCGCGNPQGPCNN